MSTSRKQTISTTLAAMLRTRDILVGFDADRPVRSKEEEAFYNRSKRRALSAAQKLGAMLEAHLDAIGSVGSDAGVDAMRDLRTLANNLKNNGQP